ncbi:NADP-dependent oxidoreductase domain-containing protein [Hyaloraphidium curvatum]|nr:NADP-dependent oxidoreductase domain-containing protein [Hyaloraphidium curvatum]
MSALPFLPAGTVPTRDTPVTLAGTLPVPPLALGVWSWGDTGTWNKDGWTAEKEKEAKGAFDACCSTGYPFFDTAEIYGRGESEKVCGRFLASLPAEERKKTVIATKFLPLPYKFSYPSALLDALRASLEKLGMDSVDLYQVHGPIHLRSVETVADALAEAVKLGLTKTVGVSNYSVSEVTRMHKRLKEHGVQLASNQVEFSLLRRLPETSGLVKTCHDLGVAVLAYSPIGMGRLSGKYSAANPPPSGRRFSNYDMARIDPLLDVMRRIADQKKVPVSAVALNWVICKGAIPLAGARNASQAEQNAKALGWRLSDAEIAELDKLSIEGSTDFFWQHG